MLQSKRLGLLSQLGIGLWFNDRLKLTCHYRTSSENVDGTMSSSDEDPIVKHATISLVCLIAQAMRKGFEDEPQARSPPGSCSS
jgi:hypothetical protein